MDKIMKEISKEDEMAKYIDEYIKSTQEKTSRTKQMVNDKVYVDVFSKIINDFDNQSEKHINNQTEAWTKEIDTTFDLIYDAGFILLGFDNKENDNEDPIIIKYKDNYIELSQFHGQGYYCSISEFVGNIEEVVKLIVDFDDIVHFLETGVKPIRTEVMKLIYTAFKSFDVTNKSFGLGIDIEAAIEYIETHLK